MEMIIRSIVLVFSHLIDIDLFGISVIVLVVVKG